MLDIHPVTPALLELTGYTLYIYSMSTTFPGHRPPAAAQIPPAPLRFVPTKGRGTPWAIEHRFSVDQRESFDDGWGTLEQAAREERLKPDTQVIEEHVKSILTGNDSPDIGFDLSINPYRGCEHGCVYCYARPTHSYLNLSPGLDFETRIVAKVNAAERLRETLAKPSYVPQLLNLGSITDCYQPVERRLKITRSIIEVLSECNHAFSMFTKSAGIERDLDLIAPMAARGLVARAAAGSYDGATCRGAAPTLEDDRSVGQSRCAGRCQRLADDPVSQPARDGAHPPGVA
jgi:hypothetical protein